MSVDTATLKRLQEIFKAWEPDEPECAAQMMQVMLDNFDLKLKPVSEAVAGS